MKKLLALTALASLSLTTFGQGTVQFQNRDTANVPNVNAPIYLDVVGGTLLNGTDTSLHAALLGGASTGTAAFIPNSRTNGGSGASVVGTLSLLASPSTAATWTTFRTGAAAGYLGVGTDTARDTLQPFGGQAMVQVVAWNGGFTTWTAAYNAWASGTPGILIGASNPLVVTLPAGPTDPNLTRLVGLESFAIVPSVPEPSTLALAGLGAAALLFIRRRK